MIIYLMFFTLAALLVIEFFVFKGSIIHPALLFTASFFVATADLMTMVEYWEVSLHMNTYCVICGGCLTFGVVCFAIEKLFFRKKRQKEYSYLATSVIKEPIKLEQIKLLACLALNCAIMLLVAYEVIHIVKVKGRYTGLLSSFGTYARLSKFSTDSMGFGGLVSNLYSFLKASGYIWGIILVYNFLAKKKIDLLVLGCFLTSFFSCFLTGSRGTGVYMLMSMVPIALFQFKNLYFNKKIDKKYIFLFACLGVAGLFSFQMFGNLIGRTSREGVGAWEYISVYLGAPILNLDTYLQKFHPKPNIWGSLTFYFQIQYLAPKIGDESWKYVMDLPFMQIKGKGLGNVYTIFYPFIHDFGYKGIVPLIGLMAAACEAMYIAFIKNISKKFSFSTIFYCYELPMIVLSFFSNKFYESLAMGFVKSVVIWIILYLFIFKIKIVGKVSNG